MLLEIILLAALPVVGTMLFSIGYSSTEVREQNVPYIPPKTKEVTLTDIILELLNSEPDKWEQNGRFWEHQEAGVKILKFNSMADSRRVIVGVYVRESEGLDHKEAEVIDEKAIALGVDRLVEIRKRAAQDALATAVANRILARKGLLAGPGLGDSKAKELPALAAPSLAFTEDIKIFDQNGRQVNFAVPQPY